MIRLASNVVAALARKVADASLDPTVRVLVLEGAAGVEKPFDWARLPVRVAFRLAAERFPNIHPDWLSLGDEGLFRALLAGARSVVGQEDAMDIAMSTIAGMTRAKSVRGGQLYDVGSKLAEDIAAGATPGAARRFLAKHGKDRALQMVRGQRTVSLTGDPDEGGGPSMADVPSGARLEFEEVFLREWEREGPNGPLHNAVRRHFEAEYARAPGKMAVFERWFENPNRKAEDIGRELGQLSVYVEKGIRYEGRFDTDEQYRAWLEKHPGAIVSATYTSRVLREIWQETFDFIEGNPRLLRGVHLQEELSGLGYGGGRFASLIRRLVQVADPRA